MEKKKLLIISAILIAVLAVLIFLTAMMAYRGFTVSEGIYLEAKDNRPLIVMGNSPVSMSDQSGGDLFEGLQTGDHILILHDGIAEIYPGSTGVYAVFKTGDGSVEEIPPDVIRSLTELGWLDTETE